MNWKLTAKEKRSARLFGALVLAAYVVSLAWFFGGF